MRKLVTENIFEMKKINGEIQRLINLTNDVIKEMHKLELEPTKENIVLLLNKGCKTYFEDVALSNLVTPIEGLKEEALRGLLELPNYSELQSSLQKLHSVTKYWSCIDIKKGTAKINNKNLEAYKDKYRTFATTKEEIEILQIIEEFKDAFNKVDKKLQDKRDNGLMIHGNWNWRMWFKYDHYNNDRFGINPNIYNHLLGR